MAPEPIVRLPAACALPSIPNATARCRVQHRRLRLLPLLLQVSCSLLSCSVCVCVCVCVCLVCAACVLFAPRLFPAASRTPPLRCHVQMKFALITPALVTGA